MKGFVCCVSVVLVIVILLVPEVMSARHNGGSRSRTYESLVFLFFKLGTLI